jgi:hypothetical protein
MPRRNDIAKVLMIGSGPTVIGQSVTGTRSARGGVFSPLASDDSAFIPFTAVLFGVIPFLGGIQFPSLWGATQLGWDVGRWYSIAAFNLILTLALLVRALPKARLAVTEPMLRCALVIVALNMASGETLFFEYYLSHIPLSTRPMRR